MDLNPTLLPIAYQNDNMYPEYYSAKSRNISGISMYSSEVLRLSFSTDYLPIEVLDLVMLVTETTMKSDEDGEFEDSEVEDTNEVDNILSGRYMVSKIIRHFSISNTITSLEICRETHPEQIGNLYGFIDDDDEDEEEDDENDDE